MVYTFNSITQDTGIGDSLSLSPARATYDVRFPPLYAVNTMG